MVVRLAIRIGAALGLGAVVSIVVAFTCLLGAQDAEWTQVKGQELDDARREFRARRRGYWPSHQLWGRRLSTPGVDAIQWHARGECWTMYIGEWRERHYACGFPCRSFEGSFWVHQQWNGPRTARRRSLVVLEPQPDLLGSPPSLVFPVRPIWRGALTNTAVYGLGALACLQLRQVFQGLTRRRRGLCRACAYPVSGALCPECGTTVGEAAAAARGGRDRRRRARGRGLVNSGAW